MQSVTVHIFHIENSDVYAFCKQADGACLPNLGGRRKWKFVETLASIKVKEYHDPPEFYRALAQFMTDGCFVFHGEILSEP